MSESTAFDDELLTLSRRLLDAIGAGDWSTYADLCDPTISCFEPEALGQLVEGMPFHQFYFQLPGKPGSVAVNTMARPKVRSLGPDAAVVTYVRLVQRASDGAPPTVTAVEETRVWHRHAGVWKHVHFHRSPPGKG
ncbi:MAG: DUF4440 domain-containing protein [Planctomycetia bacterium]